MRLHAHERGHLDVRGLLRCGCGPEFLGHNHGLGTLTRARSTEWAPVGRQHTGFIRTHFVYSDRMRCSFRCPGQSSSR